MRKLRPAPEAFDTELEELLHAEEEKSGGLKITFADGEKAALSAPVMNAFFGQLKKQVEFCATIKGYIQLSTSSLIGIRDVFQALEAYMPLQPEAARDKMLEALSFTDPSGRARGSMPCLSGKARLRRWICGHSSIRACG